MLMNKVLMHKLRRASYWLSLIMMVACGGLCQAVAASESYFAARAPVASQSASDRQQALQVALAEVLVKVSGQPSLSEHAAARQALANAGRYVQQFRYVQPSDAERAAGAQLMLTADFDPALVRKLSKASGLGLWPVNRPEVLLWAIAHTPEAGRQIITDPEHPLLSALLAEAERRGLPVLLPLWDLDDQFMLSASQLWQLDETALMAASARYDVTAVLAARYSQTSDGQWLASWQFQHAQEELSYEATTANSADLPAAAVAPVVLT